MSLIRVFASPKAWQGPDARPHRVTLRRLRRRPVRLHPQVLAVRRQLDAAVRVRTVDQTANRQVDSPRATSPGAVELPPGLLGTVT